MSARRLAGMLGTMLWLVSPSLWAAPVDQAYAQMRTTFAQRVPLPVDESVLRADWQPVPFDAAPYTYTFDELRQLWPQLMRGLKIPFPSADYLQQRYQRFPALYRDLRYQDADWQQHSQNVLEVWQAFFRGDFQRARELGLGYGGYARVPALVAQIIYANYLEQDQQRRLLLLQDALDQVTWFAEQVPMLPGDEAFREDYCLIRLGFGYAAARMAEDSSVPVILQRNYAPMVINAATEIVAVDPNSPLALSLSAAFEANVLRRLGKAAGRLTLDADSKDAIEPFRRAIKMQPDLAIVRYEYGNSLLYTYQGEGAEQAIKQLQQAVELPALFSMEWLDRAYAQKRLKEIQAWKASGMSFKRFDRKRRKYMEKKNRNLYAVTLPPFLVD